MDSYPLPRYADDMTVIGVSEMVVTSNRSDILVTYSLGSCIALSLYDPVAGVGGLIHCLLPLSKLDLEKAEEKPAMFVDTGVVALLKAVFELGATRKDLVVKVIGAAQLIDEKGLFETGHRNYTVLRKLLWKNNILIDAEDVGGKITRSVYLYMATGHTIVRSGGRMMEL